MKPQKKSYKKFFGNLRKNIERVLQGKGKTTHGYTFAYV